MKWLCVILRCCSSFWLWWQKNYEAPTVVAGFWTEFNPEVSWICPGCFYWNKEERSTIINKCIESMYIICRFFKLLKLNSESTFLLNPSNFRKSIAFWEDCQASSVLILVRATCRWTWRISGMILSEKKPKYSEENLTQCHCVHHKSHMDRLGPSRSARGQKPATNLLSHGTAPALL